LASARKEFVAVVAKLTERAKQSIG
jgi:hypothetical protein